MRSLVANGHIGQMSSLGLESVLVGDVVDGVGLAVIGNEGVGSTDDNGLLLGADVLQLALLLVLLAIAGLQTGARRISEMEKLRFNPCSMCGSCPGQWRVLTQSCSPRAGHPTPGAGSEHPHRGQGLPGRRRRERRRRRRWCTSYWLFDMDLFGDSMGSCDRTASQRCLICDVYGRIQAFI